MGKAFDESVESHGNRSHAALLSRIDAKGHLRVHNVGQRDLMLVEEDLGIASAVMNDLQHVGTLEEPSKTFVKDGISSFHHVEEVDRISTCHLH